MVRPLRLLVAVLIALGTMGILAAQSTHAAGAQVANCSVATLEKDLQVGGDCYYTAGQRADSAIDAAPVVRAASAGLIGRITPSGKITEFRIPRPTANTSPYDITAGPDANLWFTEQ